MAPKRKQAQASPPRPQFFKILLPGFSQGLRIPPQFNRYIEGGIPRKATILSPLGKSWPVEVHGASNFLYFGEGWQKFSEAHDLDVGYLVLFRYEGDMVFAATVFDRSACMKEYMHGGGGKEVDGNFYSCARLKPSGCPRKQRCLHERSPISEMFDSMDTQKPHANFASSCTEGSQLEIKINSYNPCGEPSLPLPQEFIRYLGGRNSKLAILFGPSGESWCVRIDEDRKGFHFGDGWQRFAIAHSLRRGDSLVLKHKGALVFAIAILNRGLCKTKHNLDEGSGAASVRTPTQGKNPKKGLEKLPASFHGARMHEATEPITGEMLSVEIDESIARSCLGEVPDVDGSAIRRPHYFEVAINLRQKHCTQRLEIPDKFAASYNLRSIKQLFLRDPNGHLWPASLSHGENGRSTSVCPGWRDFYVGNDLQDGDVCCFEFKGKDELHVRIHRGIRQKPMNASRDTNGKLDPHLCARTAAELVKTWAYHRAGRSARIDQGRHIPKAVGACMPGSQFARTMSRSNLVGRGRLDIPRAFVSSVDLSSVRRITLLDQRTRQWPASVYCWQERMKQRVALGTGWKAFCISNNVEVGDECVFKLASSLKHDVFHVSIIKQRTAAQLHVSGNWRQDSY